MGFSKIIKDVTELKIAEETIHYQASHDTLTGLANRTSLDEAFIIYQNLAIRHKRNFGILFLDLDRFKTINDTLGHGVGDMILKETAHRLINSVRAVDTVARLGGDEFVILLDEITSMEDMVTIAEKILKALTTVMRVQNHSLHISTSIGMALYPSDGADMYSLLKNADTALYDAKGAGRNRYQFYDYTMNLQSAARLSLEQDLRIALKENQFFILYQPFINTKTGAVDGAEALIRWQHPKLGTLLPSEFITLAEETGMIVPIGKWMLQSVCRQGKQLRTEWKNFKMAVNLSARQFTEDSLVETIIDILTETKLEAHALELEITESIAMENIQHTSAKLHELKHQGISIAIDDFGTGYSSLSYLKRFPVHKLKIDKSFIEHAITEPQDSAIIRAIISMAHTLDLEVCAEGIEDMEQKNYLSSIQCDVMQGYLISKPLPITEFILWMKAIHPIQQRNLSKNSLRNT